MGTTRRLLLSRKRAWPALSKALTRWLLRPREQPRLLAFPRVEPLLVLGDSAAESRPACS